MDIEKPSYWFEAKSFGIGWTLPATWQGWATVAVYFALMMVGLFSLSAGASRVVYLVLVSVLFVGVVAWKGERPFRWRSGGR